MSAPTTSRLLRQITRSTPRTLLKQSSHAQSRSTRLSSTLRRGLASATSNHPRCFSTSRITHAGMMPESENPQPPSEEVTENQHTAPAEVTDEEYHDRADEYMDAIHEKAEEVQEERQDVEVEYSAGVLSITFPPNGTYILNKQPPNKQIWLSSPITGPKRFDWVVTGESMHQKEGGGFGDWIYLRDGTTLTSVLNKELGLVIDFHGPDMDASKDPTE